MNMSVNMSQDVIGTWGWNRDSNTGKKPGIIVNYVNKWKIVDFFVPLNSGRELNEWKSWTNLWVLQTVGEEVVDAFARNCGKCCSHNLMKSLGRLCI